jgi:hypothetical protein
MDRIASSFYYCFTTIRCRNAVELVPQHFFFIQFRWRVTLYGLLSTKTTLSIRISSEAHVSNLFCVLPWSLSPNHKLLNCVDSHVVTYTVKHPMT